MKKSKKDEVSISELVALEEELHLLKKQQGINEKEGKLSRTITKYYEKREIKGSSIVNRKKYLFLAVLTGWMGGHRFYAKQYPAAVMYLLLCWCGFPMAMTLIDILIAIPKNADENGMIEL